MQFFGVPQRGLRRGFFGVLRGGCEGGYLGASQVLGTFPNRA